MVTNNKVLTVSYGTFSCTLEGFDDSFGTMKAIAEYFRDLASDDRYFGAEPPIPDTEMLARIAEREVERRVQARMEHGAIVLSTKPPEQFQDAPVSPEKEALTDAPVLDIAGEHADDGDKGEVKQVQVVEETPEPEIEDVTDAILEAVTAPDVEVSKPQNIVDETPVEDIAKALTPDVVEVALEELDFAEAPEKSEPLVSTATESGAETEFDLSSISAALSASEPKAKMEVTAAPVDEVHDDIDLQMISDAVQSGPLVLDEETYLAAETESVAEILAPMAPESDPEFDENSIAAKLQRIRAVVSKVEALPVDEDFSEDEHADNMMAEPAEKATPDVLTLDNLVALPPESTANDQEEAPNPVRGRIVRMKKTDFEEAIAGGQLLEAEPDEDEDAAMQPRGSGPTSLTPEDEADLLAELAEVEAELKRADAFDDISQDEVTPKEAAAVASEMPARSHHLSEVSSNNEEGVSRLLAEADQQFGEVEGSRRRNAIAHLRAAVAATKAEKGHEKAPEDDTAVYRDDLASVVQPIHSKSTAEPTRRAPKPREATPLKLVAEQRVDAPSPNASDAPLRDPVRPRRVSAADRMERQSAPAAPVGTFSLEDADSFTDFVETMGATRLPEILEAAAAYLTFVEGHPRFSRPMVMRLIRDLGDRGYSREDGLRGFGQLLRDNKIEKLEGGRFTASDRIRYKPEDRAVG